MVLLPTEYFSESSFHITIRGMVRKDVEQAIAAADSFDGFITELQNMGYTVKYEMCIRDSFLAGRCSAK